MKQLDRPNASVYYQFLKVRREGEGGERRESGGGEG